MLAGQLPPGLALGLVAVAGVVAARLGPLRGRRPVGQSGGQPGGLPVGPVGVVKVADIAGGRVGIAVARRVSSGLADRGGPLAQLLPRSAWPMAWDLVRGSLAEQGLLGRATVTMGLDDNQPARQLWPPPDDLMRDS